MRITTLLAASAVLMLAAAPAMAMTPDPLPDAGHDADYLMQSNASDTIGGHLGVRDAIGASGHILALYFMTTTDAIDTDLGAGGHRGHAALH